jgi:arylsulfatase A-like enzyme
VEPRNVICLVVDRLQAAQVGAYGNTWVHTPQLDRLAAESFLFDRALADTLEVDRLYRGLWRGRPAIWPDETASGGSSLPALAAATGMETVLLTDDPAIEALGAAAGFASHTLLASQEPDHLADEIEDTQAAQFVGAAGELLGTLRQPFFLWLHARGLGGAWEAPYALRQQYADEEDPAPPDFVLPPCRQLPTDYDPDELLGIAHAYAGQVSLWDTCLGALVDEFRASPLAASTLLVVLSPRGYPLGEHLGVGPIDHTLYNEHVQIPWLLRLPDGLGALARSQALVVPADLPQTLADWLGWPADSFPAAHSLLPLVRLQKRNLRECVILGSGAHDWAVRTPAWHLRASGADETRRVELYSKPSDRFEVNDIADRAPDVVAGLLDVLAKAQAAPTTEPAGLDSLLLEELP